MVQHLQDDVRAHAVMEIWTGYVQGTVNAATRERIRNGWLLENCPETFWQRQDSEISRDSDVSSRHLHVSLKSPQLACCYHSLLRRFGQRPHNCIFCADHGGLR